MSLKNFEKYFKIDNYKKRYKSYKYISLRHIQDVVYKAKAFKKKSKQVFPKYYTGLEDTNNCINKILLNNASEIELSKLERKECLAYYKKLSAMRSEDAKIKNIDPIPKDWPKDVVLAPLPESTNDFNWQSIHRNNYNSGVSTSYGLSIIIPTFNRSKVLEITLNNGIDPLTGKVAGIETGAPSEFKNYDELYAAFINQLNFVVDQKIRVSNYIDRMFAKYTPAPFLSVVIEDCISKAKHYYNAGPLIVSIIF